MNRRKAVGIWIRVSTEDQARGESPEHHLRRAHMYAEVKGWHVVRVYDLSGVSGKTVKDHPETKVMLADIKEGRIEALIFSKLARLARNTRELLEFSDYFQTHGADLISIQEAIDTSSPAGRLFYTLIAAMAQWEREEISERVKASISVRAKLGKSLGGAAPYGYRKERGVLVLNEQEAPIRKLMFEIYLKERRFKTVARLLNTQGHRTRSGAKFSATTVIRLLTDPIAKGQRRANYTTSTAPGKKWILKPESEWIYTEAPAIVDEATFDRVNQLIAHNATKRPERRKGAYLFAGKTICSCGTTMYRHTRSPKYICRQCRNKIPAQALELIVVEQLRGFTLDSDALSKALNQNHTRLQQKQELIVAIEQEIKDLSKQMDDIYDLYLQGGLDVKAFRERNQPLEERRRALRSEIPNIQGECDALQIDQTSLDQIINDSLTLYDNWEHLLFEERKAVVEMVIDHIKIAKEEIEIKLHYLPNSKPIKRGDGHSFPLKGEGEQKRAHITARADI